MENFPGSNVSRSVRPAQIDLTTSLERILLLVSNVRKENLFFPFFLWQQFTRKGLFHSLSRI